ncbi:hypothetical protein ACQYWY_21690 [Comamonas sediminis]|uniref:hypothetical protein n=1 Tax=Comamonas sediminis TaxID=1783360 RepID=UPI003D2A3894
MVKKQHPRSLRKKAKDAAYAALPPLRIHHPLRAIKNAFQSGGWFVNEAKRLHRRGGNGLQAFAKDVLP